MAIGLAVGAAAPLVLGALVQDKLPVPALFAIYPWPLAKAAAFGLLSAAAFSLARWGRARSTPPASLFRSDLSGRLKIGPEIVGAVPRGHRAGGHGRRHRADPAGGGHHDRWRRRLLRPALGAGLGRGGGGRQGAGRGRGGPLRIGLANLAGPHSAARTASPAIGLGVALLAAVVLIQSSLLKQVSEVAPQTAPALVFTDLPGDRARAFDTEVARAFGTRLTPQIYLRAPFVTGRIVSVRGEPVVLDNIAKSERWAYDADVTMSALGPKPANAGIVEGRWWPAGYTGPPLVAMDVDVAKGAAVKLGDRIVFQVLGREIEARVAVLRRVEFGGFGASFR